MERAQTATPFPDNVAEYKNQLQAVRRLRNGYSQLVDGQEVVTHGFNDMVQASGAYQVSTVRAVDETERLTKAIRDNKLGMMDAIRSRGRFKDVWQEQARLSQAHVMEWTDPGTGKKSIDMYVPKELNPTLDTARYKYGTLANQLKSIGTQTVNWGKNTQWAGRQIMVGLGVPLAIAAAGAGAMAYTTDQQLTRIAKVYDTFSQEAGSKENELTNLRVQGLNTATEAAQAYGAAVQDTLSVQAELAAIGVNGADLQRQTNDVMRIATLGELAPEQATDLAVTLQTAFGLTADEMERTFNYINAVENATSLSTQDIADALPRVASAMSALGGTAEQTLAMIVAMKESGVDPVEAANALKSGTTRLINPTKKALETWQREFGVNINEVVEAADGNILTIIQRLSEVTKGFDGLTVQRGINDLFGTYQFNRLSALMQNIGAAAGDTTGEVNQFSAAMQLMGESSENLNAIAEGELEAFRNSISGRLQIAMESFKASLIPFGELILKALTPVLEWITSMIKKFNELPDWAKYGALVVMGLGIAVGALIMFAGIMGNLVGQISSLSARFINLRYRMQMLSPEQIAQKKLADGARKGYIDEAAALYTLNGSLSQMNGMLESQILLRQQLNRTPNIPPAAAGAAANGRVPFQASPPNSTITRLPNGYLRAPNSIIGGPTNVQFGPTRADYRPTTWGRQGTVQTPAATTPKPAPVPVIPPSTVVASRQLADNAERGARSFNAMGRASGALGAAGIAMMMFSDGADGASMKMGGILLGVSAIGQFIPSITQGLSKMNGGFMGLARLLGTGGLVTLAIGAAVIAMKALVDAGTDAQRDAAVIGDAARTWMELAGESDAFQETRTFSPDGAKTIAEEVAMVDQLRESNEELYNAAGNVKNAQDALNKAFQQGAAVINSGGSVDAARMAMETFLRSAGQQGALDRMEIDELMVKIDGVNLENAGEIQDMLRENLRDTIAPVLNGDNPASALDLGLNGANSIMSIAMGIVNGDAWGDDFGEIDWGFLNNALSGIELGDEAKAAIERTVDQFATQLQTSADSATDQLMFDDFQRDVTSQMDNALRASLGKTGRDLSSDEFAEMREALASGADLGSLSFELNPMEIDAVTEAWGNQSAVYRGLLREMAIMLGVSPEIANQMRTLGQLQEYVWGNTLSAAEAQEKYNRAMAGAAASGQTLTNSQRYAMIESLRLAAGLTAAEVAGRNLFGLEGNDLYRYLAWIKEQAVKAGNALETAGKKFSGPAKTRGMDTEGPGPNTERGMKAAQDRLDARNKAIEADQKASSKALQNAAKASQKAFDAQQKAQDKAFEAEQKAQAAAFEAREDALKGYWDKLEKDTENRQDAEKEALEAAYDSRIDVIEAAIDAEKEAQDERDELFDREKERISRLAELYTDNIDYNAALNSGDLDEAARIYSSTQAKTEQWSMDDQKTAIDKAAEARIKALEDSKEAVQDEKESQLDALAEVQKAEDDANKARRQAAEDQLALEKEIAKERLEGAREAQREAMELAREQAQESQEAAQEALANRIERAQEAAQAEFEAFENSGSKIKAGLIKQEAVAEESRGRTKAMRGRADREEAASAGSTHSRIGDRFVDEMDWAAVKAKYAQAGRLDEFAIIAKKHAKALSEDYVKQTEAGAEEGRGRATKKVEKFRDDTAVVYRNIGIVLGNEQGVGAEAGRLNIAKKIEEARQDAAQKSKQIGNTLDAEISSGADRGRANTKAKMQGMVLSDADSLNQKFAWVGGQLAGHIQNGAQGGRDRAMAWVDWPGAGNDIGGKIAGTVGLNTDQLKNWLRTGDYPGASWKKALGRHEGGIVRHGGGSADAGPGWSSKDRQGIPRTASLYPSEVPAVLKRGEFVVNEKATRANRGLLEQVNSGKTVMVPHGAAVKHEGGMWAPGAIASMVGTTMLEAQANKTLTTIESLTKIMDEKASAAASYNGSGGGGSFDAGAMGGGGGGDGKFRTKNKNFPARQWMVASANAIAAKNMVQQNFPGVGSIGIVGQRSITSDHPWGKALDNMIPNYKSPQGIKLGTAIADWFIANPNVFGTKYVIWRDRIASDDGRGWQRYGHPSGGGGDTLQHRDHPHVSLYHEGGLAQGMDKLPQMFSGGKIRYDNTLANLHKDETVLTEPLSDSLRRGIGTLEDNVAGSGGNTYQLDLRGAVFRDKFDFQSAVEDVIENVEDRKGRRRVVSGKNAS